MRILEVACDSDLKTLEILLSSVSKVTRPLKTCLKIWKRLQDSGQAYQTIAKVIVDSLLPSDNHALMKWVEQELG